MNDSPLLAPRKAVQLLRKARIYSSPMRIKQGHGARRERVPARAIDSKVSSNVGVGLVKRAVPADEFNGLS